MSDVVINVATNVVLNKMEQAALSVVTENPAITVEQLAARLSKSGRTAQRYLDSLQKKNMIRRVGAKKDGHWAVTKPDDTQGGK
ncbi:MAG: winged helix-turn-helix transcriptional regulator [Peptococcaceae bacterium]|nr:winged helix-turn-helix transcriptional regulator [Peptococcaceae bacterium]